MVARRLGSGLAGALAFWVTNLAISLTPVAADYRAALSISYLPMLVEAAIGGTVVGVCVSWVLARFPERVGFLHLRAGRCHERAR